MKNRTLLDGVAIGRTGPRKLWCCCYFLLRQPPSPKVGSVCPGQQSRTRFTSQFPGSIPPRSIPVDPCNDFYKFACGKFAANHPIPADQPAVDQFYALYNVNTQALNGILDKAAAGGAGRSPDEQKIGDYYKAAWTRTRSRRRGWLRCKPLLTRSTR